MSKPNEQILLGPGVVIDVQRLVETRLLVCAGSGGGKSWALRRLLEQTYGAVQHVILDPEDEFASLREKHDYVLAGGDGADCAATVEVAPLLAIRLVGRMSQDIDVRRSAEDLGFYGRQEQAQLRTLEAGEFFAFGPALVDRVTKVTVGPVLTTHPRTGHRAIAPPPARGTMRTILAQLAELPRQAAAEASTAEQLRERVRDLERQLGERTANPQALRKAFEEGVATSIAEAELRASGLATKLRGLAEAITTIANEVSGGRARGGQAPIVIPAPSPTKGLPKRTAHVGIPRSQAPATPSDAKIGKSERAILTVLAQYGPCEKSRLALLAGYSYSGGFRNALSWLRGQGLIRGSNGEMMALTDEGADALGPFDPLPTGARLVEHWKARFGKSERAIIEALGDAKRGLTGPEIAAACRYEYSGGFRNSLSTLRTAGVIVGKSNTTPVQLAKELQP